MATAMIDIDGLYKSTPASLGAGVRLLRSFKASETFAVKNVSLTIGAGELAVLFGGKGAGKTTLLDVIATLSRSDAGSVMIGGYSAKTQPNLVRGLIGYCRSAHGDFHLRLTMRENLRFFGDVSGRFSSQALRKRIETVLELVELSEQGDQFFWQLSIGRRRRLSLARALLADPPVLLFDDPTLSMDANHAPAFMALIRRTLVDELGKTVLIATSQVEEAWTTCHRVAIMSAGCLIASDAPAIPDRLGACNDDHRIFLEKIYVASRGAAEMSGFRSKLRAFATHESA